jgi:uncharacterized membrane protein YsdA (DUF1294 family)
MAKKDTDSAPRAPRTWNWTLALLGLLVLPALALARLGLVFNRSWLFIAAAAISVATFFLYFADKRRAESKDQRVPEIVLHGFELAGGWPGAFVAQHLVRHKNAKVLYQVWFWIIVALHQLVALDYLIGWQILDWLV